MVIITKSLCKLSSHLFIEETNGWANIALFCVYAVCGVSTSMICLPEFAYIPPCTDSPYLTLKHLNYGSLVVCCPLSVSAGVTQDLLWPRFVKEHRGRAQCQD